MEQVWSYLLNKKLSFKRPFRVNIHQNLHAGPPWKSSPRRPDSIRRYGCFFNWPASVPVKKFFETPTKQQTKQLPVLSHFHQLSPSQWSNFQVHETPVIGRLPCHRRQPPARPNGLHLRPRRATSDHLTRWNGVRRLWNYSELFPFWKFCWIFLRLGGKKWLGKTTRTKMTAQLGKIFCD